MEPYFDTAWFVPGEEADRVMTSIGEGFCPSPHFGHVMGLPQNIPLNPEGFCSACDCHWSLLPDGSGWSVMWTTPGEGKPVLHMVAGYPRSKSSGMGRHPRSTVRLRLWG